VTNYGYSDWATVEVKTEKQIKMTYRLSRQNNDFLIENSSDGREFKQIRIFHLHNAEKEMKVGVHACSPLNTSTLSELTDIKFGQCAWELYENPC